MHCFHVSSPLADEDALHCFASKGWIEVPVFAVFEPRVADIYEDEFADLILKAQSAIRV